MAPPSYELIPTQEDDQASPSISPDSIPLRKRPNLKRPILLFAAFALFAFVFFKTGQWTVTQSPSNSPAAPSDPQTQDSESSDTGDKTHQTQQEQEDMSPGKHSIGYLFKLRQLGYLWTEISSFSDSSR
ncbi:hypothetical protein E1B28_004063 [Marasmius oreades]|uniref:Uncharacterized protein n=1 Tax=Marasmius oreades TaxID=181124 RepID=A0A9P7UXV0_9AGAR|nr:uncharacterized protein E1B28_004063 [Marasmius oreades]KAG7096647.1 hypothetical protein E1B28_004063 [Marasmius oreades]